MYGGRMEWEENFRAQLRARREASGESQSALAKRIAASGLAFHQPTVQRIEDGKRPVRLDEAHVIAEALGTTIEAMTSSGDPFAVEVDPHVLMLGRSWGAAQRQIDDALYKLTGLAGHLAEFGALLDQHPDAANALWGSEGDADWSKWVKWTTSSLVRHSPERVIQVSEEHYEQLVTSLEYVARSVVVKGARVGATVSEDDEFPGLLFTTEDDDGEHQATP